MIQPADLDLRPVRPADGDTVTDLAGAAEQVPFDDWVETPEGLFWAAEVLGRLVAVVRVRSVAQGVFHVDGLLVDRERRREGIATALLEGMAAIVRAQGGRQMRAEALSDANRSLGARAGFRSVACAHPWRASRLEGGEPARLAVDQDLPRLLELGRAAPAPELAAGRLLAPGEA
ncbi:MAG: GNAT family N-acetyltransferase, partial [Candidatus Dormibacteraceae bacterium]